jgi:Endonuclease NucS
VHEHELRDRLAENLEVLEKGLRLVRKEYHIRNDQGADGFIDIVGQDRYDNFVVIELKRSAKTAGSALHQLHKYAQLLRATEQLALTRIRCILVSTHWHDLRQAFSSFARDMPYPLDGFELELSPAGNIVRSTKISPLDTPMHVLPTTAQMVWFFEHEEPRDAAFAKMEPFFKEVGAPHLIGMRLEPIKRYGSPFALYLIIGTVDPNDPRTAALEDVEDDSEVWDDPRDILEHKALDAARLPSIGAEELEVGYVDKLRGMLRTGRYQWRITGIERAGAFREQAKSIDDDLLVESTLALRALHQHEWSRLTTPRMKSHWNSVREMIRDSFGGAWVPAADLWLDEMEQKYSKADVKIYLNHPGFLRYLMKGPLPDPAYSPSILDVAFLGENGISELLCGLRAEFVWNGRSAEIAQAFSRAGGEFMLTQMYGAWASQELEFRQLLGLRLGLFEVGSSGYAKGLIEELDGKLVRRENDRVEFLDDGMVGLRWSGALPYEDFVRAHRRELEEFRRLAAARRIGS